MVEINDQNKGMTWLLGVYSKYMKFFEVVELFFITF